MNVFLTFDYELFFGDNSGSVEKSIIKPTNLLIEKCKDLPVYFTFFIDVGFLIQLENYKSTFSNLNEDLKKVKENILYLIDKGHSCQLHIHPHWEKTYYDGNKWIFDYKYYKLSDFNEEDAIGIFSKYKNYLENLTQKKVHSFRAGGWCIQPFEVFNKCFEINDILIDSSIFAGGKHINETYSYDFTLCEKNDMWKFSDNPCKENEKGKFIELVISSYKYSSIFFWKLFVLGKIFPRYYKNLGDGVPMTSDITKKDYLTRSHVLCASVDGYFASKCQKVLNINKRKCYKNTVFLGHPKALSVFSINKIKKLVIKNKNLKFVNFDNAFNQYS